LPLTKIFFANKNTGWITGGYRDDFGINKILLKTINGGETWHSISDTNVFIHDFYFKDSLQGRAIGDYFGWNGIILRTGDGGEHWEVDQKYFSSSLCAIHYKDGCAWAVGGNGLIIRLIDTSYIAPVDSSNTMRSVKYWDEENMLVSFSNFPNPFSSNTILSYELSQSCNLELSIIDLAGRRVGILENTWQEAGRHKYTWNATDFQSGIYFCLLKAGPCQQTIKMILLK
jgi:hypothetical protein